MNDWIHGWSTGWPAHDAEAVAALYADGATFRSHPFRDAHIGPDGAREYATWAFESEESGAEVSFGEPVVSGDRVTVEYWAVVRSEARDETIAGVAVIRFGKDGRVAEQRDYWAIEDGRREPPAGWGR